ncbi:tetratricopeptide repeat protein [Moorella sp. Hama-1]|uniref:tetratricopeptide repeat protein n=1 Tax=Moorella sp. Hama-1 TaxID=2138101 RepID=UPI000D6569DB|nr:tetratricopeptide repeat protein [Moorella sp. Hama-1]BCV21987.1 hypothetical protein hamaS1_20560 [Moorella sp. Hama-1]
MVSEDVLNKAIELIRANNLTAAQEILQRAISKDRENPEIFNLLGVIDEKRGNFEAARRMYRIALDLDASYRPAQINLERLVQWLPNLGYVELGVNATKGEKGISQGG